MHSCAGTGLLITIKDLVFIRNLHYPSTPIGSKPYTRKNIFHACYAATDSFIMFYRKFVRSQ